MRTSSGPAATEAPSHLRDPFCILVWRFTAQAGHTDELAALLDQSADRVNDQPKCLFQRLAQDGPELRVHVGLEDAFGALTHAIFFAQVLDKARGMARFEGITVYGDPAELAALREPFAPFAPSFFERDADAPLC